MAIMWGASVLSLGILGILFMAEISTGSVSATIWSNEPFGLREIFGIAFISLGTIAKSNHSKVAFLMNRARFLV